MARVTVYVPRCRSVPARTPQVKRKVNQVADRIASRARARLAQHRHLGDARIERSSGSVDEFVSLTDRKRRGGPAAAAIEFGHIAKNGRVVRGLHILTGSLR